VCRCLQYLHMWFIEVYLVLTHYLKYSGHFQVKIWHNSAVLSQINPASHWTTSKLTLQDDGGCWLWIVRIANVALLWHRKLSWWFYLSSLRSQWRLLHYVMSFLNLVRPLRWRHDTSILDRQCAIVLSVSCLPSQVGGHFHCVLHRPSTRSATQLIWARFEGTCSLTILNHCLI